MNSEKVIYRIGLLVAALLPILSQSASAQGNLVYNGDFETGSNGWTWSDWAYLHNGDPTHPGHTASLIGLLAPPATPTVSQTISGLIPSQVYQVSGEYVALKGTAPGLGFGVAFDGIFLYRADGSGSSGTWQSFSFLYTAGAPSAVLSLSSQINGQVANYLADNVVMELAPEPSSLSLLGLGGLAAGIFMNRIRWRRRG